ncbi:AAA family ATPase [Bacteroides nordii]|uniref:AAA family ATPase n=1 Tax=Bacteroides nordii TaxID=291645 RepID=UPI002A81E756|nr:AAA family ATPase [Bacteroides nordii]
MKILTIRLKNLASIEGTFEVDFTVEPLRSAGIFAISGPTGAGKSTILDALCLALYDKTPRFAASGESLFLSDVGENQVNQSDVKNILRRGTGEGFAEVDFLGATGRRYRSRWSVRRARSKATGSLQPQTLQVTDLDKEEDLQGTKTELLAQLVSLVGLTYEQFTRTVLLAQNDFATFLKSRESAKAELLEKLTGTEIYSRISREIYTRSKAADETMNLLKNSISLIELLPEDELQNLQKEKERLIQLRTTGTKRLAELNAQFNIVRSLVVKQEQLTKKQQEESVETEKLKKLHEDLLAQTGYLAHFREQWEALQPELLKARELDVRLQSLHTDYKQSQQTLQLTQKQVADLEKRHHVSREALSASCSAINRLLKSEDVFNPSLSTDLDRIEHIFVREEQQLALLQKENDDRVSRLNAFGIQSVGEEQNKLLQEQSRLQHALQAGILLNQLREKQKVISSELDTLTQQLVAKQEQTASLQRLYENARMAMGKDVVALRHDLREGEACPVCGSLSHPYGQDREMADTLYHSIEKEYRIAVDAHKLLNDRCIALQRDVRNIIAQEKTQEEVLAAYSETERTPEHFDTCLKTLRQRLQELEDRINQYQQLYAEWQQKDEGLKKLRHHCESLREGITRSRLLMQQAVAIAEQLAMVQQTETTQCTHFKTVSEQLQQLQQQRATLLKGKPADEAEAVVRRKEKELNDALESARKSVEQVQTNLSGIQGELKQLSRNILELSEQQKQIENPETLSEAIAACQSANQETEHRLSTVEACLLQQEQNKKKQKEIEAEWKEKQDVAEQWGKLNKLIGSADGTKFKVIAQSYTLNLLLLHANKHLSYLSKRYKLQQVSGTLALQVIDCDMCDEVRTVYSLSGGESFLISLALALGLSSLSSNNLKVESLFIDEGFGSLDADSLRTAMEALEQLQMQGRKIGVISHVQEMSERISVQIQLHKSVNGKSEIVISSV